MMGVMALVGGYFTTRAVSRELAVSRLQSEFVSAVSHEFRKEFASSGHRFEFRADHGLPPLRVDRARFRDARLHPDGRRVAILDAEVNFEVSEMENFLPAPKIAK
jgi:hypothetical protein